MGYKLENIVGNRYGKLLVLNPLESKQYGKYKKRSWECLCDCGNKTSITTSLLINGKTKSCGCLHKIASVQNSLKSRHKIANKDAASNSIYSQYKGNAKARKYIFELTKEEFRNLIKQNCFYCGTKPLNLYNTSYYNLLYNGIDRLDNTQGYTLENSVSCCKMCNISKNNHSLEYFFNWIKNVYHHNFIK